MHTPVLFAPGFRGKVASALLCVVSCVKRAHVGTADMTRQESINKMVKLAHRLNEIVAEMEQRKLVLLASGFGEG